MTGPKRNRRALNAAQQWQPLLLVPILGDIDTGLGTIELDLSVLTGTDNVNPPPLFGAGIPNFILRHAGVNHAPTACALTNNGVSLVLTYPAVTTGTSAIYVNPWDPTFRTASGGYIAPAFISFTV